MKDISSNFTRRSWLPLLALSMASFGIGTTEFVIMGLLPDVAHDLAVTIPQAGLLVSGYALGVAFGAPILAVATARLERRLALLLLIGIFILGNCLCAVAPSYALLMGARIVTAFSHGAFFGLGAVVAANVAPPAKRAQAIALMFTGLTLANVLGVPFGTALGQAAGWRATFGAVVMIGLVAALALFAGLPRGIRSSGDGLMQEARTLGRVQVLLAMLISVLASASLFSVFTYITPILENVTRESPHQVTWVLLIFGVGLTLGNILGGRLADWRLMPAVIALFILLIAVLAILTITSPLPWLAGTTIFIWCSGLRPCLPTAVAGGERGLGRTQSGINAQPGGVQYRQRRRRLCRRAGAHRWALLRPHPLDRCGIIRLRSCIQSAVPSARPPR